MARFKLMGYEIKGQEQNTQAASLAEQSGERPLDVVYETDDQVEARAIAEAGGFFRDRDNFITVTMVVDSTEQRDQPDTAFFRPSPFPQKGN